MNANLMAIIRTLLSLGGAYLLGHNLFGTTINESLLQEIIGAVMITVSLVWTILDKTAGIEKVEGFIRQFVTALGGLFIGLGVVKEEVVTTISSILIALLPYILSLLGKKKSQDIATGELGVNDLAGVKEITNRATINPVVNTPR